MFFGIITFNSLLLFARGKANDTVQITDVLWVPLAGQIKHQ